MASCSKEALSTASAVPVVVSVLVHAEGLDVQNVAFVNRLRD